VALTYGRSRGFYGGLLVVKIPLAPFIKGGKYFYLPYLPYVNLCVIMHSEYLFSSWTESRMSNNWLRLNDFR